MLMIFCVCAHQRGPQLYSYNINASFSPGWLQARLSADEGTWELHGSPEGHTLSTLRATRIGGVFGDSLSAGACSF